MTSDAPPIAIVGVAAALPGAHDLDELAALLEERRDLVARVPDARRRDAGLSPDRSLADCALLHRIDAFDHAFFGLSLREARQMDPQQRLLLELSCRAIWDAGRPLAALAGSRTAVVFGAARELYSALLDPASSPLVTGTLPAALAGRVAYTLDLRGPAIVVDTACSSSLMAVHEAGRRLAAGEVDWALAGGVRLYPVPPATLEPGSESIVSPRGRSRSFDAGADGAGLGEGGAVFLLRTLADAQRDGDPVHAVILGGASHQDGSRSNGFAAPSAQAQEEVLLAAWQAAGVHPNSLGMIEGHGTGTPLGDPIEFQALSAAFSRRTDRTAFCVLGSIKSNVGHLDSAAGAAGLLKAVVALRTGRRYASAHFDTPNPLLETGTSALLLSDRTEPWDGPAPRRAGVSSFGLTGTNVHLVVEQAPPSLDQEGPADDERPLLVPVAARSEAGLRAHAGRLAAHLRSGHGRLADLAQVQATGRDHERFRVALSAATAAQAVQALQRVADGNGDGEVAEVPDVALPVLLVPHEGEVTQVRAGAWLEAFPALRPEAERLRETLPAGDPGADQLLARLTLVHVLVKAGVPDRVVIGNGSGNLLVDLLRGECDLPTAAAALAELGEVTAPDADRLTAVLNQIRAQGEPVGVALWPGELACRVAQLIPTVVGLDGDAPPRAALLALLAALYRHGVAIDWDRAVAFLGGYGRRVFVPTALFRPTRCWVEQPQVAEVTARADAGVRSVSGRPGAPVAEQGGERADAGPEGRLREVEGTDTQRRLAAVWCELLQAPEVGLDDDFFQLGGDSLMQVYLENAIRREFGVEFEFEVAYEHPTVGQQAAYLEALISSTGTRTRTRTGAALSTGTGTGAALSTRTRTRTGAALSTGTGTGAALSTRTRTRTGAALSTGTGTGTGTGAGGPRPDPGRTQAPATASQRRMWLLQQLNPEAGAYNVVGSFELDGPVDAAALSGALDDVAARHHVLRTRLVLQGGVLTQQVAPPGTFGLSVAEADAGDALPELLRHATQAFDLAVPGAARALLLRDSAAPSHGWFQLVLHHAICDERSMEVLLDELVEDYAARQAGKPSPVVAPTLQFTDWAAWEATLDHDQDAGYWRERLAGVPTRLKLPTDFPYGAQQDYHGAWLPLRISAEMVTRMRQAARARGSTLFAWLMTGYAGWLARVTQTEDFVVGVPVAGRNHCDVERLPGCFINTLALRVDASGDPGFETLFDRVRGGLAGAFAHQRYPFDRVVEHLAAAGDASRPPLVQTLLSMQGSGAGRQLGTAVMRPLEVDTATSWFDLAAVLWDAPDGGLSGIFAYRTALFEEATIRGFRRDWMALLEAGLSRPHESIHTTLEEDTW